jgi:DeoR/GlpR family transcriptional regulator of sugar metabolism
MLYGTETVMNASRYRVDKMFFSTGAVTESGLISAGLYDLLFEAIAANAIRVFYLVDHNKVNQPFGNIFCDFSKVDCVISDYDFPKETKDKYPGTEFVLANE